MIRFLVLFFASVVANAATVTLAWDEPVDTRVSGYHLYRSTSPIAAGVGPPINVGDGSTFVVNGLATGKTYHFVVTSYSGTSALPALLPRCAEPPVQPCELWSNEVSTFLAPVVNTVPLDFGTLSLLYTSRTRVVTVTNSTIEPLQIVSLSYTGNGADFGPRGSTCTAGAVVAPGASCTLAYVFRPTRPGARAIVLTARTSSDSYVLNMTGTGRGFVLLPETLDYGIVQRGQYPELVLTFKALWPLTISNIVKGGSAFIITNSTCVAGAAMVKDQTCTATVKMVGMTAGFKGGSLRFETDVGVGTAGFRATVQ